MVYNAPKWVNNMRKKNCNCASKLIFEGFFPTEEFRIFTSSVFARAGEIPEEKPNEETMRST